MNLLDHQISSVSKRFRRLDWWKNVFLVCILLTIVGGVVLGLQVSRTWMHPHSGWILLAAGLISLVLLPIVSSRRFRDDLWLARQVEHHYPELEQRVVTTLDEIQRNQGRPLGYLQHTVFQETITHANHNPWSRTISSEKIWRFRVRAVFAIGLLMSIAITLTKWHPEPRVFAVSQEVTDEPQQLQVDFDIMVDPENTEIEKGICN